MLKIYFGIAIMAGIVLLSCNRMPVDKPIIKVGGIAITEQMVDVKLKIEQCYSDAKKMPERWLGLYKLIDAALLEDAAKGIGIVITPEMLDEEAKRVDAETKAPELLASVKVVCPDTNLYKQVYLKPGLVNRLAHYKFAEDKTIQEVPYDKAKEAFQKANEGKDLRGIDGYKLEELDLAKKTPQGAPQNELNKYNLNMPDVEREFMDKVLNTLQPGQVFPTIREDRYGFYVIKLLEKREKFYKYEMITVKKKEFERWFNEQVMETAKEIFQPELPEQILKNVNAGVVQMFLKK